MRRNHLASHDLPQNALGRCDPGFLRTLYQTRSVAAAARISGMPERDALRSAMIAYGLGELDFRLHDF